MNISYFKKPLSEREFEVLTLSSEGFTDKDVASKLSVSLGTIHTYWTRIRSKCDGRTRAEILVNHVKHSIMSNMAAVSTEVGSGGHDLYRYRLVFEQIPAPLLVINEQHFVRNFNTAFLRSVETHHENVSDKSVDDLPLHKSTITAIKNGFSRCHTAQQPVSLLSDIGQRLDIFPIPAFQGYAAEALVILSNH